jgi:hypothetical protein
VTVSPFTVVMLGSIPKHGPEDGLLDLYGLDGRQRSRALSLAGERHLVRGLGGA